MKLLSNITNIRNAISHGSGVDAASAANLVTPAAIRAAITIVASAPNLMVYPFLQKYFASGLTVGGIKE